MKKTLAKLLCGVLMLAMPMALFAKKSKNDSIYRPLYTAFEINIGGAAWKEKPLSYFTYYNVEDPDEEFCFTFTVD